MNTWIRSGMCSDVGGGGRGRGARGARALLQAVQAEPVLHVRVRHQRRGVLQQTEVVQVQPRAQLRLLATEHARVQLARVVSEHDVGYAGGRGGRGRRGGRGERLQAARHRVARVPSPAPHAHAATAAATRRRRLGI